MSDADWGRLRERKSLPLGPSKWAPALKLSLLLIPGTLIYGAMVPVRRIQLTHHEAALARLAPELDGFRLVQLSDLHSSLLVGAGQVRRAVRIANGCNPDLVVITGDFVSFRSMQHLAAGAEELRGLRSRYGVFACLGNHEHWEGVEPVLEALAAANIRVLVNESTLVAGNLWLAGIDDLVAGKPDLPGTAAGIPDDAAVALMSHSPMVLPEVANRPWLVLAGHTHGGQVSLPFLGPRRTIGLPGVKAFARFYEVVGVAARRGRLEAVSTYRYPAGWYHEGQASMYVNRGVGVNPACPVRLNCPAEVALFVLRAESTGGQDRAMAGRQ